MEGVVIEVWTDESSGQLGAYVRAFFGDDDRDEDDLADELTDAIERRVPAGWGGRGELSHTRVADAVGDLFGYRFRPEGVEI